jgi:hypothetical protein
METKKIVIYLGVAAIVGVAIYLVIKSKKEKDKAKETKQKDVTK